jgi:hypothetical protein
LRLRQGFFRESGDNAQHTKSLLQF